MVIEHVYSALKLNSIFSIKQLLFICDVSYTSYTFAVISCHF